MTRSATTDAPPPAAPNAPPLVVRTITKAAEWEEVRADWDALFAASPAASPPLHFDWLSEWWRIYGPRYGAGGGLRVLTAWRGTRLVAALPLYESLVGGPVGRRRLQFLSTGETEAEETCPDYLDLLALPGEQDDAFHATADALAAMRWDELVLSDMADASPLVALQGHPSFARRAPVEPRGACPIANLDGGFEAYLARLSSNLRQQSRRTLRSLDKAGAKFEVAEAEQVVPEFFDQLVRLHQQRWQAVGKPGCFAADRFTEFHRALARRWVPQHKAVLARLSVAGEPLAVVYGFLVGDKFDFYQSGVRIDENSAVQKPGVAAHLMLMSRLAEAGVTKYDFLRGASTYKERLATDARSLVRVRAVRPTVRTAISAAADVVGRASRKGLRMIRQKSPPGGARGAEPAA